MSPIFTDEKLDVSRVAVIGAGPCGLAAAKYLAAEKKFSKIDVFEQRATVGGVWNHTPLNLVDRDFTVPRTQPTKFPDSAIWSDGDTSAQFVSPVYDFLETNIPHTLMNYSDQEFPATASLFPKHEVVTQYLQNYSASVLDLITLETQILGVERLQIEGSRCWRLDLLDLKTSETRHAYYDAVMVASGHYNDPFIPQIPGLAEFNKMYPGSVSHSKYYRRPDIYAGKKVVIVGNSASGIDLSAQISAVSQLPVIVSEKAQPGTSFEQHSLIRMVPEIAEFIAEGRLITFNDGRIEKEVDCVVFCTGYFYSFPFLKTLDPPVITDGSYARHLYEHILYIDDPTLAFLGIPQRVVPFPVSEAQSAYVARVWAGRLPVPSRSGMLEWEAERLVEKGEGKAIHNLAFPKDVEYINKLHDLSLSARRVDGLENHGMGINAARSYAGYSRYGDSPNKALSSTVAISACGRICDGGLLPFQPRSSVKPTSATIIRRMISLVPYFLPYYRTSRTSRQYCSSGSISRALEHDSMTEKRIVLITGGNTGIGYEAVKALLQSDRAYIILMGSRSVENAKTAARRLETEVPNTLSAVEPVQVDIASDESIKMALEHVKASHDHIDALVNNAGGQFDWEYQQGSITLRESWNKAFDVNVSGTHIMTHVFMPLLLKSSDPRLLFITSGLSSLQNTSERFYPDHHPPPPGWPKTFDFDTMAYRSSKTALNMMMLNWSWRLTRDGVKTWCVSPGFLATGLGNDHELLKARGAGHPSIGGNFIRNVIEGLKDADIGKIVHSSGQVQPF
ncbi:hypothetical protein JX266_011980 [Neoarthrinium moseri]|nr:hypothetical protein JX266_011980 [Neoarthrinium moseri]